MINEISKEAPQINSEPVSPEGQIADQPNSESSLQPSRKPSAKRTGLAILGLMLLATVGFFGLRSLPAKPEKTGKRDRAGQVTPVTVATVTRQTVPVQLKTIGTVQATSTVSVTSQASGRITGVYFKKGQRVQKGDLLFTIDDRTQAASIQQAQAAVSQSLAQVQQARATLAKDLGLVRQAEATLAKDQAQAQFAQAQSDRYNNLYKQGAISQDQAQQYITNSRVSAATLQADREAIANAKAVAEGDRAAIATAEAVVGGNSGALQNTQVQATYTKIYAPIAGRVGNILVTEGNVVQANGANPLVTIAQVDPIQVSFAVPEANLPEVQKRMENGKLKVAVNFAGSSTPMNGVLSFVNNTVDNATGTIQLIGDFDNADGKLFPGQFVNTTLTLSKEPNAIVVPDRAVQNGPDGQFVFVVDPDDSTVENVPVTVSHSFNGLDVIQKGLNPGDQVVTDGQANLVSGGTVRVKTPGSKGDTSGGAGNNTNPGDHRSDKPSGDGNKGTGDADTAPGQPRRSRSGKTNPGGDS
ncbi:MAG: efflux RND transporter periplasmic adaptor subunit [Leptolyngbya sp.]|nr:MAG: efflux RND transporter periplasmic adaptor subunit [Leptolyngbya sp.]